MEFVRVQFARSRNVEMDNTIIGKTNDILIVEGGTHRFDLGQPLNYLPAYVDRLVQGTSPADPLVITFETVSAAVMPGSARLPVKADAPPSKPRKPARPARTRSTK